MGKTKKQRMSEIYPNYSEPNFKRQLVFEFNSWFSRNFLRKKSRITPVKDVLLLDLGTDKRLIKEEEVRRFETLVIEAQKP